MTAVEFVLGLLALLFTLLVSIALHELGHLVMARRFGVPVSQYMIGFGPTLWSHRSGSTEYGLKAIPLGGYVRMKGMYPDGDDSELETIGPGTPFFRLRTYKRVLIMLAGPLVNLGLALVLMVGTFWGLGAPAIAVGTIADCSPVSSSAVCTSDDPAAPASAILREGDVLVALNGQAIERWDEVVNAIRERPGGTLTLTIERDGIQQSQAVRLASIDAGDGSQIGYLGVTPQATLRSQSLSSAGDQVSATVGATFTTLSRLPLAAASTLTTMLMGAEPDEDRPVSLVGAGHIAGTITSAPTLTDPIKLHSLLLLAAQLNLALFIINMVPLPPFDGGHIAVSIYQAIRDRIAIGRGRERPPPVKIAGLIPFTLVVIAIFGSMSLVFIVADFVTPVL